MDELADLRLRVAGCVEAIVAYDYYQHLWHPLAHKKPLDECNRNELLTPFQAFWEALPQSMNIRRQPFFTVCDLAEELLFGCDQE